MSPLFNPVTGTDNRNSPEFLAGLARWKAENEKAQLGWEAWTRQNPEAYRLSNIPEPGYSANTNITGGAPGPGAGSPPPAQINPVGGYGNDVFDQYGNDLVGLGLGGGGTLPTGPVPGASGTNQTSPAIQQLLSQINGMAKTTSQFGATGPNLNGGGNADESSLAVNWSDMF